MPQHFVAPCSCQNSAEWHQHSGREFWKTQCTPGWLATLVVDAHRDDYHIIIELASTDGLVAFRSDWLQVPGPLDAAQKEADARATGLIAVARQALKLLTEST